MSWEEFQQNTEVTIETLDAPDIILSDVPLSSVGSVWMHESLWVSGVPQTQGVANLMSCHLDQVVQPDTCRRTWSQCTHVSQCLLLLILQFKDSSLCLSTLISITPSLPCFQLNLDLPRIQNSWLSKWISPRGGRNAWASSPFRPSKQGWRGADQQSVWLKV